MITINCDDNPLTLNKKNYLMMADQRLGGGFCEEFSPTSLHRDYILNIQPCTFVRGTKWTGLWHIDVLLNSDLPEHYKDVDSLYISTSQTLYPHDKAQLLFQAIDPVIHTRNPEVKEEFDFVLCGSLDPVYYYEREKSINILKNLFSFNDFGKGYNPRDYVGRLSTARVQFINSGRSQFGKGELAQRFFECLAIGPVLVNWTEDLAYTGLIEDRDYMAYKNSDEMIAKMKTLIADPQLRHRIAESGRQQALLNHTYEHRLISILNDINYNSAGGSQQG